MPTAVTPTKAIAEAEARSIAEAEASAASTKAALEVRQILDVDIPYIRQKHLWCRSAPPIDVRDTIIGSPVTIRWVRTNADTQVFSIIDVQGALPGSPVTFRWVRTNTDAYSLAHKPSHGQSTTPHGQPHRRRINNLITNICTINAVWATSLPVHRQSTPLHEFRQRRMGSLIAGTRTTSSQTLAPSTLLPTLSSLPAPAKHGPTSPASPKSPTLPIATLPALLAGIGFTMTEALPSISWRPALTLPMEAAHIDLQASLTLPTLPATPPKSATPNQGLPASTSSELPQRSLPTSAPSMPYGRSHRQHLHHHRRRDKIIAGTQKTSSPTSAPSMPYGQPCRQHLHRQLSSNHGTTPDGLYHRWRQRLGPHRHQHELLQPYHFVHGAFLKTLAKLATVLVGECINTIALGLIAGTSAISLITSYTGPFLRRLPRSQPSWWGNVLIPGSFPFDLSPVSSGLLAHYK